MPLYVSDLIKHPEIMEQMMRDMENRRPRCPKCGGKLGGIEEMQPRFVKENDKWIRICEDCYFDLLGDFIEQNPIGGHLHHHGPTQSNIGEGDI